MASPFIGEIQIFGFNFAPRNWATCDGQLMSIAQNTALFSLVGTTYGGDGRTTFALPDLRGRVPNHEGQGAGLPSFSLGQADGEETHTLTVLELASHSHLPSANTGAEANASNPINNIWGQRTANPPYAAAGNGSMSPTTIANAGGGQPHNNLSPYLVLNFCIALQGIFPSRN